ncbi:Hypothetical protein CINCED_3A024760 [Cinara cedri]|uniref:Uncharacterized protein n=1 Tax=Cinara cedri TaxID=506608 RepID=A0A5E4NJR3_9HEMI|nr:Hypothetical protein CINCED_3A024760 [Cinara cedri]
MCEKDRFIVDFFNDFIKLHEISDIADLIPDFEDVIHNDKISETLVIVENQDVENVQFTFKFDVENLDTVNEDDKSKDIEEISQKLYRNPNFIATRPVFKTCWCK